MIMKLPRRLAPIAVVALLVVSSGCYSTPSPDAPDAGLTYSGEDLISGRIQALQIRYEHLRATGAGDTLLAGTAREILSLAELRMESQVAAVAFERERMLKRIGPNHQRVVELDTDIERLKLDYEVLAERYR